MSREQRFVFGEVADLYDRVRERYPDALVDDVLAYAAAGPGTRALEVGAGTGKASVAFAARGLDLTCLEPAAAMAAFARRNLAAFPHARVVESAFESFEIAGAPFDLVFAAQSFHWVDPKRRLELAANALRPRGALAVFGNLPRGRTEALEAPIQRAYAAFAPALVVREPGSGKTPDGIPVEGQITSSGLLADFATRSYFWSRAYGAAEYAELLATQSNHRLLEPSALSDLLAAVGAAIAAQGGTIEVRYEARLILARRR